MWMCDTPLMLGPLGPVIAPRSFTPADWASLPAERCPLVLAPLTTRGWFGGVPLVALDPVEIVEAGAKDGLARAASMIEQAMSSDSPLLCATALDYDGSCTAHLYHGGLVLAPDGWRTWGSVHDIVRPPNHPNMTGSLLAEDWRLDVEQDRFVMSVAQVREAIAAGDVYVLNLTARLEMDLTARLEMEIPIDPGEMFAYLVARGGGEMSAFFASPERTIASVSPERFLAVEHGQARIEPIKGTRPRGIDTDTDRAIAIELLNCEKERAEHVMVVDMERNDLGRVCVPGSVRVDPLFEIVPTPYCHQMVSTVWGTLRDDVPFRDVLAAIFPCGSVTGAPKIAAMQMIDTLEASPPRSRPLRAVRIAVLSWSRPRAP